MCNFEELPEEIIRMICEHVTRNDIHSLMSTSRTIHSISQPFQYRELHIVYPRIYLPCRESDSVDDLAVRVQRKAIEAQQDFARTLLGLRRREGLVHYVCSIHIDAWWPLTFPSAYPVGEDKLDIWLHTPMWETILDFGSQCTGLSSLTLVGAWLSRGIAPMFHRVPKVTKLVILRGEVLLLPADVPPNNTVKSMTFGGNMDGGLFLSNILPLFGNLKALYLLTTKAQRFRYRPSGLSDNSFRTLEKFVVSKLHPSDLEDVFEWISSCLIMLQLDRVTPSLTHLKIDVQQIEDDDIWRLKCTLSHCPLRCLVLGYFKMVPADIYDTLSFAFSNLIALTLIRQIDCHEQSVEWTPREMVIWEHATEVARFPNLVHFGWNYRPFLPKAPSSSIILLENDFFEPLDFEDDDIPNDSDTTHEMSLIVQLFASRCPNLQTMTFDPEEIASTNGPSMNYKILRSVEGLVSVDTITDSHCFSHYNPISPNNPEWS